MRKNSKETIFVCASCGEEFLRWQGKCENCGEWNTLKEVKNPKNNGPAKFSINGEVHSPEIMDLSKVKVANFKRVSTKIGEFDRVLGGGIVPGSIILLGGDPGIGKSTLLLQVSNSIPNVLYISGEESAQQIKLRFDRLGLKTGSIKIYTQTNLDQIINQIIETKPPLVIIDSIQTMYSQDFPSTPGSLVQVRECSQRLQMLAKNSGISIILIGHVTKEGEVAGPRTLEHLVDIVLYLEGENFQNTRILRGVKNRFGATDEIGVFEMTETGLIDISNPSKLFLSERLKNVPGSCVTAIIEGTRALLVEIQALTTATSFGFPQRRSSGYDLNRLQLIIAVLQKRANIPLQNQDVFVNVAGGVKTKETAVDLAVALAIASSLKNVAIENKICAFGEIGLSGEIRSVSFDKKRQAESVRLGFDKFVKAKTVFGAVKEVLNV